MIVVMFWSKADDIRGEQVKLERPVELVKPATAILTCIENLLGTSKGEFAGQALEKTYLCRNYF